MLKIKLKPEFQKTLKKLLNNNEPELADKNLKNYLKEIVSNTNYKLESILIHEVIPKSLERWIRRFSKKHNFNVSFTGGKHYNISITTDKTREVEEQRRKEENDFWTTWNNSPG